MMERPILFSGPMVRAILDGDKTQTRRVVNLPVIDRNGTGCEIAGCEINGMLREGRFDICSYGGPGDRLWVRETYRLSGGGSNGVMAVYCAENTEPRMSLYPQSYKKLGLDSLGRKFIEPDDRTKFNRYGTHWHSSIHMPRWASRITLEVVSVRVERVQDITGHGALAEGCDYHPKTYFEPEDAINWFRELWDSINAKRGFGWLHNPWVWVIEFRMLA